MKYTQKSRAALVGGTLLLAAISSAALTVGRTRGAALIGRPLDLSIQVRLDSADEASVQCFEADVFHADTRVDGGKVSVQLEPGASPQDANLRIRSSAIVDEPVVTVYLRAGCNQRITRRYVLLADFPTESAPAVPAASVPPAVSLPARPAAVAAPVAAPPASAAPSALPAGQGTAVAPQRPRKAAAVTSRPAEARPAAEPAAPAAKVPAVVRRKPEGAATTRARLKLEPLDLTVERDPTLRASTELLTAPADNPQQRAMAAALWQALNAQPQDMLRDAQRIQTLEANLKSANALNVKSQTSIGELRTRLEKAESERYANGLVYALAALLALALGAAVYFWRRAGTSVMGTHDWWRRGETAGGDPEDLVAPDSLSTPLPARAPVAAKPVSVDVDLDVNESMFASLKTARLPVAPQAGAAPAAAPVAAAAVRKVVPPPVDHVDFQPSMTGGARAVNVEELFDIQQQADFFLSLGQHEQAIEVLKNHISDNVETSALAYLDLLKIYHQLDRRDDYSLLREDFNKVFNAQVPVFDAFTDAGSGLEAYHKALSRIEALWPSSKVLEIIEESIFRKPGSGDGEAFDLEAYRELLLLYAMAKDVVERGGSLMDFDVDNLSTPPDEDSRPPSLFSSTTIQPLSASLDARGGDSLPGTDDEGGEPLPEISMPRPSPRLGLDIDLTELEPSPSDFLQIGVEPPAHERAPHPTREPDAQEPPAQDSNLIDFDLFDAATERDIAPKRPPKR